MIKLRITPNNGSAVTYGSFSNLEVAREAGRWVKQNLPFKGRIEIEYEPSPLELELTGEPAHTKIIAI